MNCEQTLLEEVAASHSTPKDISQTYALALKSPERPTIDWAKVNAAIIQRWSLAVLKRIKSCAWNGGCFEDASLNANLLRTRTGKAKAN